LLADILIAACLKKLELPASVSFEHLSNQAGDRGRPRQSPRWLQLPLTSFATFDRAVYISGSLDVIAGRLLLFSVFFLRTRNACRLQYAVLHINSTGVNFTVHKLYTGKRKSGSTSE
jgi:hypothetical protein